LTCSESTQSETKQYYDASQKHDDLSTLNDLALSPAGIVQDSDNSWKAILCVSCFRHLGKGKAGAPANPPPLAICNNFAALPLPEEIASFVPTWAELSVCALSQVACLYTVNGRNRQKILSHSLVFRSDQPAATALPRALTSNESYIIFANLNTSELEAANRKHHLVRKNVTDALLSLYQKDLPRYKDIPTNTHYVEQQFQTTDSSGEPTTAESARTLLESQAAFEEKGAVIEHLCRNDNDDTAGAPSEIIQNAQ